MDYTSIHIYGHLLSDDVLHGIEQDTNQIGNRDQDFGIDINVNQAIDYAWSSLRNDWEFFRNRSAAYDTYGTKRARALMERIFMNLGYELSRQNSFINIGGRGYDITYLAPKQQNMPFIVVGDKTGDQESDTNHVKCTLDMRQKGTQHRKSPHATMLDYLNNTESVYGIIANGTTLRLIRNSGQLVKLTYIEFDILRMVEEDKYAEFCLFFRLLHASRFTARGDEPCIMEHYFNMSIESGNRIRAGLSVAVQKAMTIIGTAALSTPGVGNDRLREAVQNGQVSDSQLNKELIHLIYRLLFLFIIEDRGLVYQLPSIGSENYKKIAHYQEIYNRFYAASRFRNLSEKIALHNPRYTDLWVSLNDTFRLFFPEGYGEPLGIKPLGGKLFRKKTLSWLQKCDISNKALLDAFTALNQFEDEKGNMVKINYSSLDVEEFGSVYEGILEMRPYIKQGPSIQQWKLGYVGGLDRKSTSSYYTRPDLVQNLIRTTLEPVIEDKKKQCKTPQEQERMLLGLKVCDASSGSGHIALAMARTIAWHLAVVRTGEDNPASPDYREALREVIQRCIYAVDMNPDAVELCKVVLWIEGYCAGKPLSFLDHHIRCGNSVVGVSNLQMLINGVPDNALSAEDKVTLKKLKELNKEAVMALNPDDNMAGEPRLDLEDSFGVTEMTAAQIGLGDKVRLVNRLPEDTLEQEEVKQSQWESLMESPRVECLRRACDIYTYAFYYTAKHADIFKPKFEGGDDETINIEAEVPYTKTVARALQEISVMEDVEKGKGIPAYYRELSKDFKTEVMRFAKKHHFFHWCVEFPEVFTDATGKLDGFDVMCGNPPWDKLQMEEEKWFAGKDEEIVEAENQSQRKKLIVNLQKKDPVLFHEYEEATRSIASEVHFIRESSRFPLTNGGKIELSSLFAELCLNFTKERWGMVLPTGIAVNEGNKKIFGKLVSENRLISIYDFENKEGLFNIHRMFKFCLLTVGKKQGTPRKVTAGFYLTRIDHLLDPRRIYTLDTKDFERYNPNSKLSPICRSTMDLKLLDKFYRNAPILVNEQTGEDPWGIRFMMLFNMASASSLFRTRKQLDALCGEQRGNSYFVDGEEYVPLYEGKMIWLYNHHYGAFPNQYDVKKRPSSIDNTPLDDLKDTNSVLSPWYWVKKSLVESRLIDKDKKGNVRWEWNHSYYIAFRDVTNATNERTCIASLMPSGYAAGHNAPLVFTSQSVIPSVCFLAMLSSLPFDYVARQKVGGSHMNLFVLEQQPVLTLAQISAHWQWEIARRVAELCYFNHDLDGWAEELNDELTDEQRKALPQLGKKEPWIYNSDRRAVLQAELDAIFGHLYGLSTDDMRYILDPEDVCGKGCINETFRVLRDNEIRQYGEYRTKRLVMEAWCRFGFDK